jgi:hypothetical protein
MAAPFAILTKSGITNVPASAITGNLGVSPIASTAITGFSLVIDSTNTFSRSSQVTGKIYAADYAAPTPANLTTAVSNMQAAYTDAAGRTLPDFTNLYGGNLSGRTLTPGLYKWSTGVLVTTAVTLAGASDAVWIFQIAGNLTMGSGAKVLLSGGAQARNIFWQVGGGAGVEIGTTAHVEGTLLALKAIHLRTGASLNGRALSQTAVTLDKNKVVIPSLPVPSSKMFVSVSTLDGWVLETAENSSLGGVLNSGGLLFTGDNVLNKQYRSILSFNTSGLPDNAVIIKASLKIRKAGVVGTDPFTTHGKLLADIRKGFFSTLPGLQPADFQAPASRSAMGVSPVAATPGLYQLVLGAANYPYINKLGPTQFRLRFQLDDNNDKGADYVKFYAGDYATAAYRPVLVVEYTLP